jgi:hypothetical protein
MEDLAIPPTRIEVTTMRMHQSPDRWISLAFAAAILAAPLLAMQTPAIAQSSTEDGVRERIERTEGLNEQQRQQMRENLEQCRRLGFDGDDIDGLFQPGDGDGGEAWIHALRRQERVLAMAREGMPADLVVDKLQEGRRKGAREDAIERVLQRMEARIRIAHRQMSAAREQGVTTAGDAAIERDLVRGVALDLWRGLEEGDLVQLRERARERIQKHDCTTLELAAASETATQLREQGMVRTQAVELAGEALRQGYTAQEMRQLGWIAAAAKSNGAEADQIQARLRERLGEGEPLGDMIQHMHQWGWMGPGDEHGGHGQNSPVDDHIGGHQGGQGGGQGGDDPGGQGGSGGSGSGSGNGGGGNGQGGSNGS